VGAISDGIEGPRSSVSFPHKTHILPVTRYSYSEYELTEEKAYAIRGCSFRFNIAVLKRMQICR
jgi:hypothetical protein